VKPLPLIIRTSCKLQRYENLVPDLTVHHRSINILA
jgi:hypothetical protein